jgi:tetratricopeptide (TPR) repeat protein/SAM-dependent methyltransferase
MTPAPDIRQAASLHQSGKLPEAEAMYRDILKDNPRHFDANHLLGVIYVQQGNPEKGAQQITIALGINPKSAAAHSNLGNAMRDLKRPAEALESYARALAIEPRHADALFNRGNALKDLGRLEEAAASYAQAFVAAPSRADFATSRLRVLQSLGRTAEAADVLAALAKLKPQDADTQVMLGNALAELRRHKEALAAYDAALTINPQYAEVMMNRGNMLRELGRNDEALQSYSRAFQLKPDFADAPLNAAQLLLALGRSTEAEAAYRQALALDPARTIALHGLGNIFHGRGLPQEAIPFYTKAAEDPAAHAALFMLADCHFQLGDLTLALNFLLRAISAAPQEVKYKENFILYAEGAKLSAYDPAMAAALLQCLETPGLDCSRAAGLWHFLLLRRPDFGAGIVPSSPLVATPFFLRGIEKLCVYDLGFERALTDLRHSLLLHPEYFDAAALLPLATAMAAYCFNTDYIFDVTPEETAALKSLQDDGAFVTALRACYAPLGSYPQPETLAKKHAGNNALASLLREQVEEPQALAALRARIPALTPISRGVSTLVRGQYEESPYPKWKSVPRHLKLDPVAEDLAKPGAKILIAGCGTGQEAAEMATALPQSGILAVDLSLSSLCYAKRQAERAGLTNILFKQADILQLDSLSDKFDGICSGGVLHHLEDPMEGWRVLAGLLKDGGLMRIALYSKAARRHITVAREAAKKGGFAPTPDGMRAFRHASPQLLPPETFVALQSASDYFNMPMYRDMLFHYQEHCFDLPQIESSLKNLGLEFLKLLPPASAAAPYKAMFGASHVGASLEKWHRFEEAHPDTFIAMYQFWCRKPLR